MAVASGVLGVLGAQLGHGAVARSRHGGEQRPAQLGAQGQSLDHAGATEPLLDVPGVGAVPGGFACEGPGEDQLPVRAGCRREQRVPQGVEEHTAQVHTVGRGDVLAQCLVRVVQHGGEDRRVALPGAPLGHHADVVPGVGAPIADRGPQLGVGDGAGQGVLDLRHGVAEPLQGARIRVGQAVGEVRVVHEHERVAHGLSTGERRGHGLRQGSRTVLGGHAHLGAPAHRDGASVRGASVDAHGQDVRAQGRGGLGEARARRCSGVVPRGVGRVQGEHRDAGGVQPQLGPGAHVVVAGLVEHVQEVGEVSVAECEAAEVGAARVHEGLFPHEGHQLFEHRGALGVGDAVEVLPRGLEVHDVRDDRVCGAQLVLAVRPLLARQGEGDPRVRVLGGVDARVGAHELGEGLLQPEVVPPAHGHQVTEPHVGHLVHQRVGPARPLRAGGPGREEVVLGERHHPGVLHGTQVVLRHERLLVLAERVGEREELREEVQALLGEREDLLGVHGLGERPAAVQRQRDAHGLALGVSARPLVRDAGVGPGEDGGDVAGDPLGGRELVAQRTGDVPVITRLGPQVLAVGRRQPALRCEHREVELGLEVRLLEHREDPAAVCRLVLRVDVDTAVLRVHIAVQALA